MTSPPVEPAPMHERSERLAGWSVVALVAAAVFSGSDNTSIVLVVVGLLLGIPAVVVSSRSNRVVQSAIAISAIWLLAAMLIGSLPSPGRWRAVEAWAGSEGRVHLAVGCMAVAASIRGVSMYMSVMRRIVGLVVAVLLVTLPLYYANWSPPWFPVRRRALFLAATSSHHVVGFLAAAVVLLVIAIPFLCPGVWRWVVAVPALYGLGLSGSRSAFVGLAAGLLVVVAVRRGRRGALSAVAVLVGVAAILVVAVPRYRQTVEVMTRPNFGAEAVDAFRVGTTRNARRRSTSVVEANILIRFALWGNVMDEITTSPLVGIGVHRLNDVPDRRVGVAGVAELVVSGERRHSQAQPHNMYLFLLAETGIVGIAIFSVPYVLSWRRLRRPMAPSDPDDRPTPDDDLALGVRAAALGAITMGLMIGLFSAALLTTGLGLVVNAIFFGGAGAYASLRPAPDQGVQVTP